MTKKPLDQRIIISLETWAGKSTGRNLLVLGIGVIVLVGMMTFKLPNIIAGAE